MCIDENKFTAQRTIDCRLYFRNVCLCVCGRCLFRYVKHQYERGAYKEYGIQMDVIISADVQNRMNSEHCDWKWTAPPHNTRMFIQMCARFWTSNCEAPWGLRWKSPICILLCWILKWNQFRPNIEEIACSLSDSFVENLSINFIDGNKRTKCQRF